MALKVSWRDRREGFTLIEVLVVVAIIALLVSILLPSLSRARAHARSATCLSNLHQFSIGVLAHASQNKGKIPGETQADEEGWAHIVARQFKIRPVVKNFPPPGSGNDVMWFPVDKLEVFHCPERKVFNAKPFLDYVHNTLDPNSKGNWSNPQQTISIDEFRYPADIAFITDAEREDRVNQQVQHSDGSGDGFGDAHPTVRAAALEWYDHGALPGSDAGIDIMDIRNGLQLPQGPAPYNQSDKPGDPNSIRRVARKLHMNRFTNTMFFDGHAAGIQLKTDGTAVQQYAYWLRIFGVKDYLTAAQND